MKATMLTVLLWSGFTSQSIAQHDSIEQFPGSTSGVIRVAESSTFSVELPNRGSSRRPQAMVDNQGFQGVEAEPNPNQSHSLAYRENHASFNATQPVSRLLINPDQFWTRKSRPVIDQRGEGLFGDPRNACDEWKGLCGCCGFKTGPGHLGQKWLGNGDPCECVDDCCPGKRPRGCQRDQCESCQTDR